ncbi:MAG: KEOPS complex subunit Pcc1 [Thermoplasmata archaeon]|nr:KEOPS complex subunit Pcc1 [Thermoplasmata archaeon]
MSAEVRIQAQSGAGILAKALGPESRDEISRTEMEIAEEQGDLVIRITADDIVSLRAALNSYLRWTKLALDTKDAIGVLE